MIRENDRIVTSPVTIYLSLYSLDLSYGYLLLYNEVIYAIRLQEGATPMTSLNRAADSFICYSLSALSPFLFLRYLYVGLTQMLRSLPCTVYF